MIDIKKVFSQPKDEYDVIKAMVRSEQRLLSAIHIFQSILDNTDKEDREIQERMIKQFLAQFETVESSLKY